jgi:heptosyltransferase-3
MGCGDLPDLSGVKKILVVKLRQLGDVLLTGPVFSALRKAVPGAQIDAYIYEEGLPLLEGHPGIDGFVTYDRKWKRLGFLRRLQKEWGVLRRIRKEGYDWVINLTEGDRGVIAAKWSGASVRVGFEPKGKRQRRILTHVVKHCPSLRHTVEKNLDALRRIGIFPGFEERDLTLEIPEGAREAIRERLGEGGFVLIHPASNWLFKCWPVEKMRQLTEELIRRGKRVVFSGGPDAAGKSMVAEIVRGLEVVNLAGMLSLKELAALIERAQYLICVDSLPFHIASALKKPVIGIWGPSSEVNWGPWRNPHARIVAQKFSCRPCYMDGCGGSQVSDCLVTLPVQMVLNAVEQLELTQCVSLPSGKSQMK